MICEFVRSGRCCLACKAGRWSPSADYMQATAELHQQLRHGSFRVYESNPRMLPRLYEPTRRDVDCSIKTPAKEPVTGKRGRGAKAGAPSVAPWEQEPRAACCIHTSHLLVCSTRIG